VSDKRRISRRLTEAQIVEQSKITPDDITRARAWWKSHAPPALAGLFDAEIKTEDEVILPDAD
jgi:hypothetical protein